ncbi:MAG: DUF3455 domain-containing protein [Terriglobales bacterium]
MRWLYPIILVAFVFSAAAQDLSRPDVPEKIKAPPDETVVLRARGIGSQIYTCQQGSDGKYAWTLKAPEAELLDAQGSVIGRHFAGPTWKHNDGSEVKGKAVARVDAPEPNSVPWLLVAVTDHSGNGILSRVTNIQRIHTGGGQPTAGVNCDAGKLGTEMKSSYSAEYVFYAPRR